MRNNTGSLQMLHEEVRSTFRCFSLLTPCIDPESPKPYAKQNIASPIASVLAPDQSKETKMQLVIASALAPESSIQPCQLDPVNPSILVHFELGFSISRTFSILTIPTNLSLSQHFLNFYNFHTITHFLAQSRNFPNVWWFLNQSYNSASADWFLLLFSYPPQIHSALSLSQ